MTAAEIPRGLAVAIAAIYAVLLVATAVTWLLRRRKDSPGVAEVADRIRSWWYMVVIFTVAVIAGPVGAAVLFAAVSLLALREYLSLVPTREGDRPVLILVYLALPAQYAFVVTEDYGMFTIFIPVYVFLAIPAVMAVRGETPRFLAAAGTLYWGMMLTVYAISHIPFLLGIHASQSGPAGPAGILLFLVALTQVNDVAQFLWGKALGTRKIAPRVSPNKTLEGLVGGVLTTGLLAAVIAPSITPFTALIGALFGVGIGIAGYLGDITMSAVKRDLEVKDTGTLLPGHGGILDRIDSLVFTAPLFFHAFRYFYS